MEQLACWDGLSIFSVISGIWRPTSSAEVRCATEMDEDGIWGVGVLVALPVVSEDVNAVLGTR